MIDLQNIKHHIIDRPVARTLFGTPGDFDGLPDLHKEQILFLDKAASKFIYEFCSSANLIATDIWDPFSLGNFKTVVKFSNFSDTATGQQELKKWLFKRGIPFQTRVFVLPNYNDHPVMTTWKILIKYANDLFYSDDLTIFDSTLNWCLFFYHEGALFFGKDKI